MEKKEKAIELAAAGMELKKLVTETLPRIREEVLHRTTTKDKHRDGFDYGRPVQSLYLGEISYASFTGTYGDSSVYSDLSIDSSVVRPYVMDYLNSHKDEIMLGVAELILEDARQMRDEAVKKYQDAIDKLKSI